MTKLAEDIKRIAGIKDIVNRIKGLEEKQPIQAVTTYVWTDSNGNIKNSTNSVGEDALGQEGSGGYQSAADAALAALDGKAFNGVPGQGGVSRGATDGVKDILDLLDDVDDVQLAPDANGNPLTPLSGFSEVLAGVSGLQDCDNPDYDVTVYLGDQYPPPEGWTTADSGGAPVGFQSGYYWTQAGHVSYDAEIVAMTTYHETVATLSANPLYDNFEYLGGELNGAGDTFTWDLKYTFNGNPFTQSGGSATIAVCGGVSAWCPVDDPTSYIFPVSQHRDIAKDSDGNFVSHPYERPTPTTFKQPKSTVVYCTSVGRMVQFSPNKFGGTNIVEIDSGTGAPTGVARIFRKDGSLAGYSDTASLSFYEM